MKRILAFLVALSLVVLLPGCSLIRQIIPSAGVKKDPVVTITMDDGSTMKLELYNEYAPNTVANFVTLAQAHFYDGLTFHRIIQGFMVQSGDPLGNGTGGPGYAIKGEFAADGYAQNTLSHTYGVISMARTSDNMDSAGSQFFICTGDDSGLDGQYAAFGKLLDDADSKATLDALDKTATTWDATGSEKSVPVNPPKIKTITVETYGETYDVQKIAEQ